MLAGARHLVQYFRRSTKAMTTLRHRHAQDGTSPSIEMPIDVSTRWNSTYVMIKNLISHQWTIRSVLCDPTITPRTAASHLELGETTWNMLTVLAEILEPFKAASDHLEGDYVTVSSLIPLTKGLLGHCEEKRNEGGTLSAITNEFCNTLINSLKLRFRSILETPSQEEVNLFQKATWLHPCHKGKFFDRSFRVQVRVSLEMEATEASMPEIQDEIHVEPSAVTAPEVEQNSLQGLFSIGIEQSSSSESEGYASKVSEEISQYLKEKLDRNTERLNPLLWWHARKTDSPSLHKMANRYLAIPCTSAPAERAFSSASLTVSRLRTRLSGTHVNELNFLHCNRSLMQQ
ncbi:zinc finger BED domain-containing protein 6-like [Styela clava]